MDWGAGKSYKSESNRRERQYEKQEIKQALQEEHEGSDYRYPRKSKKRFETPDHKELHKTKKRLAWDEKRLRLYDKVYDYDWILSAKNRIRHDIAKNREKIKKLLDKIK